MAEPVNPHFASVGSWAESATMLTFEPRRNLQCLANRSLYPHQVPKVVFERIEVDGFHRLGVLMRTVLASSPLGLAHFNPIGGLITGAAIVGLIDKALHQPGAIAVT